MATSGIYCITPEAGINLYRTSLSIGSQKLLTKVTGSDGRAWIYGLLAKAQTSVATVSVGAAGSVVSCTTTTAVWMMNAAGGLATANYAWIRRRTL